MNTKGWYVMKLHTWHIQSKKFYFLQPIFLLEYFVFFFC